MDQKQLETLYKEMIAERDALDDAIMGVARLMGRKGKGGAAKTPAVKRKAYKRTAAQRKKTSARLKKYWAEQRKKNAPKPPTKKKRVTKGKKTRTKKKDGRTLNPGMPNRDKNPQAYRREREKRMANGTWKGRK